jgi:hypothetical protein
MDTFYFFVADTSEFATNTVVIDTFFYKKKAVSSFFSIEYTDLLIKFKNFDIIYRIFYIMYQLF